MNRLTTCLALLVAGMSAAAFAPTLQAADPVRGRQLYTVTPVAPAGFLSCATAACHGPNPASNINKVRSGANNGPRIQVAIDSNAGGMIVLKPYFNAVDLADIGAYIANPTVTGAPVIGLSATTLTFAGQAVGTTSAVQTITVSNTGTSALLLTNLAAGGAQAAEFVRAGTCAVGGSVAAGASCTLQVSFAPTAVGTRTATLTIVHNAPGSPSVVGLTGTANPAPAAAAIAPAALLFTQMIATTSIAQMATLRNTGGLPMTVNSMTFAGAQAAEFAIAGSSTCAAGLVVAGGASCMVGVSFTPAAAGASAATLSIAHSASATPISVGLAGTGTAVAQPGIGLSASSLTFADQAIGTTSGAQTLTVTNGGQAALVLSAITRGGVSPADFATAGTCAAGGSVSALGTCTITVTFAPGAAGSRGASLTIASNAANGNAVVSLTGAGVQRAVSVTPTTASFPVTEVGTLSPARTATVRNTGAAPLSVTLVRVDAPFELATIAGSCGAAPFTLAAGAECAVNVVFRPMSAGSTSATLTIATNAPGSPSAVALNAEARGGTGAATNVGFGGCSAGDPAQLFDPLLVTLLLISVFMLALRRWRL